ncbi:MAG: hypothetical protein M3R68_11745, partial [Acidobacteriota bacterium]|nr:hypothetical protein [Acidobacteriota bacterium]
MSLLAQAVVETTLFVSPQRASLPTLVSTENVIASINNQGYELADSGEVEKIAGLINTYYLPTQKSLWQERTLDLRVSRMSSHDAEYYTEIQAVRNAVTKAARDVVIYESQSDFVSSKQAQDAAVIQIANSVESRPT